MLFASCVTTLLVAALRGPLYGPLPSRIARPRIARHSPARALARVLRSFATADLPAAWPYDERDMRRIDESADVVFYGAPRFVTHIDEGAIRALTAYYRETLAPGSDVLDLCSSWVSHLPEEIPLGRVAGLGMNARELEANNRLTEWVQADLNTQPVLPFDDASFDMLLNVVSVCALLLLGTPNIPVVPWPASLTHADARTAGRLPLAPARGLRGDAPCAAAGRGRAHVL